MGARHYEGDQKDPIRAGYNINGAGFLDWLAGVFSFEPRERVIAFHQQGSSTMQDASALYPRCFCPQALGVRRARDGETCTLLDGREAALTPEFTVITDAGSPSSMAKARNVRPTR